MGHIGGRSDPVFETPPPFGCRALTVSNKRPVKSPKAQSNGGCRWATARIITYRLLLSVWIARGVRQGGGVVAMRPFFFLSIWPSLRPPAEGE